MIRHAILVFVCLCGLSFGEEDHTISAASRWYVQIEMDGIEAVYRDSTGKVTREKVETMISSQGSFGLKTFYLFVGGDVPMRDVLSLLSLLRKAGFENVYLNTFQVLVSRDSMLPNVVQVDDSQWEALKRLRQEVVEMSEEAPDGEVGTSRKIEH